MCALWQQYVPAQQVRVQLGDARFVAQPQALGLEPVVSEVFVPCDQRQVHEREVQGMIFAATLQTTRGLC